MNRAPVIAAFCIMLAACGFQLRGNFELPAEMADTYVSYAGGDGAMLRTVVRALNLNGIRVKRSAVDASAILHIPSAATSRRLLSKDSDGRPREYELTVTLNYRVTTPEGIDLILPAQVSRRSNIELNPVDPLGNSGDIARAVASLREDAVWDMLGRIAAAEALPAPVVDPGSNGNDTPESEPATLPENME